MTVSGPQEGFISRGWRGMSQSINDAVSGSAVTAVGTIVAAGIVAIVSYAIWSSSAIAGLQTDMASVKVDVHDIREAIYEYRGQADQQSGRKP